MSRTVRDACCPHAFASFRAALAHRPLSIFHRRICLFGSLCVSVRLCASLSLSISHGDGPRPTSHWPRRVVSVHSWRASSSRRSCSRFARSANSTMRKPESTPNTLIGAGYRAALAPQTRAALAPQTRAPLAPQTRAANARHTRATNARRTLCLLLVSLSCHSSPAYVAGSLLSSRRPLHA